jgi:hypothetical protein
MAEWSKALVLGTSLFGGVGSNPTPVTFAARKHYRIGGLAQSVECVVRNDEAPGSKPGFSMFCATLTHVVRSFSLVVRTPRCGRGNPGSNPGRGTFMREWSSWL